jgi:transcriptional regulator with XRE-family HTH domain
VENDGNSAEMDDDRPRRLKIEEITRLMNDKNISRAELARRTKMSLRQIKNILNGKTVCPREDTITSIATALGVKAYTLYEDHEGEVEKTDEGGIVVKTKTTMFLPLKDGVSPEQAREKLIKMLTARQIAASDEIIITILRDDDETQN